MLASLQSQTRLIAYMHTTPYFSTAVHLLLTFARAAHMLWNRSPLCWDYLHKHTTMLWNAHSHCPCLIGREAAASNPIAPACQQHKRSQLVALFSGTVWCCCSNNYPLMALLSTWLVNLCKQGHNHPTDCCCACWLCSCCCAAPAAVGSRGSTPTHQMTREAASGTTYMQRA
jgi:hypothetical protein